MNVVEIYDTIEKVYNKLDNDILYKNGFEDCLKLFKTAFRLNPSLNLNIENKELKKKVIRLEIELDEKDYELLEIKKEFHNLKFPAYKIMTNIIAPENDLSEIKEYHLIEGFQIEQIILSSIPEEIIRNVHRNIILDLKYTKGDFYLNFDKDKAIIKKIIRNLGYLGYNAKKVEYEQQN